MKKFALIISVVLLFFAVQLKAQNQIQPRVGEEIPYPQIPRVSAYEVYTKYKSGKVILLYAGGLGQQYKNRRIMISFNMDFKEEILDKLLPKFPKRGMEIFTYCY